MLTKKITYKDFSGNEREGILHFNLTRAELIRWMIIDEGLIERLQNIQTSTGKQIIEEFDGLIRKTFGVRSDDGKRFVKNNEIYEDFVQTALYDEFFTSLVNDPKAAEDFVHGVLPAELVQSAQKDLKMQQEAGIAPNPGESSTPNNPAAGGASGI